MLRDSAPLFQEFSSEQATDEPATPHSRRVRPDERCLARLLQMVSAFDTAMDSALREILAGAAATELECLAADQGASPAMAELALGLSRVWHLRRDAAAGQTFASKY